MSGGLLSTAQPRADQAQRTAGREQADARPAPSVFATIGAGINTAFDTIEVTQEHRLDRAYDPVVRALGERGVDKSALRSWRFWLPQLPFVENRVWDDDAIWREVEKQRAADPEAFKELGTREAFEQGALTRGGNRARDLDTMARGNGLAGFAGSMIGAFADPVNVATLPIGGFGKTVAARVITEGLAQGAITTLQTPQIAAAHHAMGEEYDVGDAAFDIATAAVGGMAIRGGIEAAPRIDAAGYRALAPLRERLPGGTVGERDLARAFARMVPDDLRTPEQSAALHVITRAEEVDAVSPFRPTHAGLDEHAAKLAEAMEAIETAGERVEPPAATLTPPRAVSPPSAAPAATGGRLHGGIVSHLRSAGIPEPIARGIAAGIEAESRSDHSIVNPTSGAFGIGQWLGPRKKELFRRFGRNPSMEQQLDFLVWELRGGDHGGKSVLGAADEAEALRRYIVDFMRPAAGKETTGDLQRGMAALGRGEEDLPVGQGGSSGAGADDGAFDAALLAEKADVAARRAGLQDPELDSAADAVDPTPPDIAVLDQGKLTAGLVDVLRPIVRETGGPSLNRIEELAADLGVGERDLRAALDRMVGSGELGVTRTGLYRRKTIGGGSTDDMVRFVASRGGLSYDGLSELGRSKGSSLGHDLRNSGNLNAFIPGIGPLLRPGGKGLDEMGELLHEAGFFGSPSSTARPTEREVIDTLDELLRTGRKRYAGGGESDTAVATERTRRKGDLFQSDEHYDAARADYDAAARAVLGRDLDEGEFLEAFERGDVLPQPDRQGSEEFIQAKIVDMINRRLDDALDDAFLEVEDDFYDLQALALDDAAAGGEGAPGGEGGGRRAADTGDQGEGGGGGAAGPRAAGPAELDQLEADGRLGPDIPESKGDVARFDADDGDGVRAIAESDWHDIRAGQDPALADRRRQEAQLGAEAPLRGANKTGQEQDGTMGLGLFDAADQPTFDLGDGKGARTAAEIDAEIAADRAAIEEIRACLK